MFSFQVNDMTCGHCVGAITHTVHSIDRAAEVTIDLGSHRVDVESRSAGADAVGASIRQAGYTPVALGAPQASTPATATSARKGCCCG